MWSPRKIVQTVLIGCICRSRGQKIGLQNAIFMQSSSLKLQGPELLYLVYNIIYRSSTKVVQIMPLGPKSTPDRGSQFNIELYKENFKRLLILNRYWEFNQAQQEGSLGGPLPKLFKWF